MANTFFTSDPHFGHDLIRVVCKRPYDTVDQMDQGLIDNWNSVVQQGDMVYLMGDVFLYRSKAEALAIREKLNGNIALILGNHDSIAKSISRAWAFIADNYMFKTGDQGDPDRIALYLSHCAHRSWPKSHSGAAHLYGHSHGNLPEDLNLRAFDVGMDCWNCTPVSLSQVKEKLDRMAAARAEQDRFLQELDLLEAKAKAATAGPYSTAHRFSGTSGFEVEVDEWGGPRIANHLSQPNAEYLAALTPELVQRLITIARGVGPEKTEKRNEVQCGNWESGGYQCELREGHEGRHRVSDQTIAAALGKMSHTVLNYGREE